MGTGRRRGRSIAVAARALPRRVLLLGGLVMGAIGSCTLPNIKPPSL